MARRKIGPLGGGGRIFHRLFRQGEKRRTAPRRLVLKNVVDGER